MALISCGGCAVGSHHTSDAELERKFVSHRMEFEKLSTELAADEGFEMIRSDSLRYRGRVLRGRIGERDVGDIGLTTGRLETYRRILGSLGVLQITKTGGAIEYRVDQGSVWNGDSNKGLEYCPRQPRGVSSQNLDSYRIGPDSRPERGGRFVYKPLGGNWYLYLFVN